MPIITKNNYSQIPDRIRSIRETKSKLEIEEQLLFNEVIKSNDPSVIAKAQTLFNDLKRDKSKPEFKSFLLDPYSLYQSLGFRNRPFSLSYDTLRNMSKAPIIRSVIGTRIEQVAAFSEVQDDDMRVGWRIRKKKGLFDKGGKTEVTDEDKKVIEEITNFLNFGGVKSDEEDLFNNFDSDDFDSFLRKIVPDALILDQMTFEVSTDKLYRPSRFLATDGATFRLAENNGDVDPKKIFGHLPRYVQILNGVVYQEFYPWELCFGMRNPSTNIYSNGYGRSELEDLIRIITWMLYGDAYNGKFFSQGAVPKGILKLAGNVNETRLMEFKQQWQAQITGVQNAWKTPVLEADKMEWVDLQKSNQDMQFQSWQEYLIKLSCAIYKIDPSEIGFPMQGSMSGGGSIFEANQQVKIEYSQEKGLKPLLKFIQRRINKHIVHLLNPDYEFVWTGIDIEDENKRLESDIKLVTNLMGYKEIRESRGLPRELPKDDMIFNQMYFNLKQQEQQQQGMGGGFGGGNPFMGGGGNPFMGGGGNPFMGGGGNPFMGNDNPFMGSEGDGSDNPEDNPFMKGFNQWIDMLIEKGR